MQQILYRYLQNRLENANKKSRGQRYDVDDKVLGLHIQRQCGTYYNTLSTIFGLPSRSTLGRLLQRIPIGPGIHYTVLSVAKAELRLLSNDMDKTCVLMFDEMSIRPNLQPNVCRGEIDGFEHLGNATSAQIANHAQVFMIKMIRGKSRKQPIAYHFVNGAMKSDVLKVKIREVIEQCREAGFNIIATVCDQGSNNQAAINKLVKDTERKYQARGLELRGYFFEIGEQRIIPLFDVPHLFKGLRNNLLKYHLRFTHKHQMRTAKWDDIVTAYHMDPYIGTFSTMTRITDAHVMPDKINKMKVSACTQVFSHSMSVAILTMTRMTEGFTTADDRVLRMDTTAIGTAELLEFLDTLFDSLNGSRLEAVDGKAYRCAVNDTSPHLDFWTEALRELKTFR